MEVDVRYMKRTNALIKFVWLLMFLISWPLFVFAKTSITDLRISQTSDESKFVFDLDRPFTYQSFLLSDPYRLVIDFTDARKNADFSRIKIDDTPVKRVRSSIHDQKNYRVVLDLKQKTKYKIFTLNKTANANYRLIVDFKYPENKFTSNPEPKITAQQPKTVRDIVVVIDPGHGGKDPGARGKLGTREKDVVLAIAKKLQAEINKQPGFKAVLTRNGDYYLGLRQRLNLAHKHKGDMFVAIHADAFKHQDASGASVFALSENGATSEAARWLAQRENESELVGGVDLTDKDKLLRSVLIDLSQTYSIGVSLKMGNTILEQIGKFAQLHHNSVEQAAFVVLKSPDIPSILVETGFLSNPSEEKKLRTPEYQSQIALALMQGIKSYFTNHPPRGTTLAMSP